jgi:hypothetical protein
MDIAAREVISDRNKKDLSGGQVFFPAEERLGKNLRLFGQSVQLFRQTGFLAVGGVLMDQAFSSGFIDLLRRLYKSFLCGFRSPIGSGILKSLDCRTQGRLLGSIAKTAGFVGFNALDSGFNVRHNIHLLLKKPYIPYGSQL